MRKILFSIKNFAKWYFNTAAKAYGDSVDNYSNVVFG